MTDIATITTAGKRFVVPGCGFCGKGLNGKSNTVTTGLSLDFGKCQWYSFSYLFITSPTRSLRESNIFTLVCLSVSLYVHIYWQAGVGLRLKCFLVWIIFFITVLAIFTFVLSSFDENDWKVLTVSAVSNLFT